MDPQDIPVIARSFFTQEQNVVGTISGQDIGILFVLLILSYILARIINYLVRRQYAHLLSRREQRLVNSFTYTLLFLIAFAIAVPALFDLSLNLVVYLAIAGIIVIWLASQKVITNAITGIALLFERPAVTGDFIASGDSSGRVIATGILSTIIQTSSGVYVRIPNDEFFSTRLKNYRAHAARRFEFTLGIRFRDDIWLASRLIRETLEKNPFVLSNPQPEVFASDIGENAVQVRIRAWFPSVYANERDDIMLQESTLATLKDVLEMNGVAFPYPQRVLHFSEEMEGKSKQESSGSDGYPGQADQS